MHSDTSFLGRVSLEFALCGIVRDEDGLVTSESDSESTVKSMSKLLEGFLRDSLKFPVSLSESDSI